MSVEQRNAAMATLFGSDAVRGANVLYKLGAEGIRDYVTAVDDQGAATRMAATLTDNLSGDLEALGGSLETLFITSGEGATGPLRLVVQTATELLNAVGELPGPLKTAGIGLTGISSAGLLSLGAIGTLVPRVREARVELANLGTAGASANRALGFLGKAGAYGAGLTVLHVALSELGKRVDDLIRGTPEVDKVTAALTDLASGAGSIEAVGRAARGNQNDLRQFLDMVENPKGSSEADAGRSGLTKMLEDIDLALRDMVLGGAPAKAAEALRLFAQESDVRVPEVLPYLALDSAAASAKVADAAAEEAGLSTLGLSDATGQAMTSAAGLAEELDALDEEVSSLTTSYDYLLGRTLAVEEAKISSRGALRDLITTIEEGQEENESLAEHQDRVTSSLIRLIEQVNQEYEALVRAGEASGTTADRNEFLRGRLDQVANALPGLRGQIADYQAKLDNSSVAAQLASGEAHNLAASLARLKSPEPIRITVDTSAADAALERFFGSMGRTIEARLRLDATTVNARGDGPGRGGPALSRVNSVLAGIPGAYVTSTYRTPEQNRRVGGSPTSYHLDKSNPAVDIGGRNLGLVASRLRSMGGWREGPLWQVPGHFDHVHVAHQGGMVAPTWPKMAGLGPDERMGLLQVGERVLNRSETAIYNSTVPASVSPAGGKNIIHNHYETKVTIEGSLWHVREAERAIDKVRRERAYQGGR
jgi:hypothetical protein